MVFPLFSRGRARQFERQLEPILTEHSGQVGRLLYRCKNRLLVRDKTSGEAQMVHLVMTLGYDLILVNPYVAIAGQNVDVRF